MIDRAIQGDIELVLPAPVLTELERVLQEKFGFSAGEWLRVRALLDQVAPERAPPAETVGVLTGDPADDVILACAAEARVDVLVTGDRRHLLPVGEYRGVRVLTPQALLAELS